MIDDLANLFQDGLKYTHTAGVLQQLANLVNILSTHYMKDVDAKNKALDHVCALLQAHKEVAPAEPEAPCGDCNASG